MKKMIASVAAVTAALGGGLVATAPATGAAPPEDITCAVTTGPGGFFGVSGRGFPPAELVTAKNSAGAVVGTFTTTPDGFFEFTGLPNDTYTVTSKFAKVTCAKLGTPQPQNPKQTQNPRQPRTQEETRAPQETQQLEIPPLSQNSHQRQ
jgi:hypothetical protein